MLLKIAGFFSFAGGVIIAFLTVAFLVIKGSTGEIPETLQTALMIMIIIFGASTMYYVIQGGVGKGKPGSKA